MWISGYKDTKILGYQNVWISGILSQDTKILGYQDMGMRG